jgi:hypothetical protein
MGEIFEEARRIYGRFDRWRKGFGEDTGEYEDERMSRMKTERGLSEGSGIHTDRM